MSKPSVDSQCRIVVVQFVCSWQCHIMAYHKPYTHLDFDCDPTAPSSIVLIATLSLTFIVLGCRL